MRSAVIIDAIRTPVGRRNGKLAGTHAVDLAAHALAALVERAGVDPAQIDDVLMGCVSQVGEQSINIGRNAALAAGFPVTVPGLTLDRQCGSSQQAANFAAQGVMAGAYDLVIAAGVESMTRVPMGSSMAAPGSPFGPALMNLYPGLIPQGLSAEMIAKQWNLSREDLDAFAYESHRRALSAIDAGHFKGEISPISVTIEGKTEMMVDDEGPRRDTSPEKLGSLKPAFQEDGVVTAGNSSQISDGAAAVLIGTEEAAARLGIRPRARFHTFALAGVDPVIMLTGPIPATEKVLERSGLNLEDIGVVEINEAFASVVLAWEKDLKADMSKVNPNGGAIALGHPLGCSGARLLASLLGEMERTGARYGLQTMCEGGGMANATIIERLG